MATHREEDKVTPTPPENIAGRLEAMEKRLAHLETLLVSLTQQLEHQSTAPTKAVESIQTWVTDYVSMRLQQLVPETCEHEPASETGDGPYLPGTTVPCTDDVVHRVGRIPIPFVRQMVVEKVAQQAQQEHVTRVDVAFFERAATF
jgi:hypothetical protein